jgi:hypothetical protein
LRSDMNNAEKKLTLDRPLPYQIKVPGKLDRSWADRVEGIALKVETGGDDQPFTTLTGTFDQAALHGLLQWLYALGLPLASVICLVSETEEGG